MVDRPGPASGSLRSLLLWRLMPPLIALFVLSGTLSFYAAGRHATDVYDRWLVDSAESLAQRVTRAQGRPELDLPDAARAILQWDAADATWYQVRGERSGHIAGHVQVPGPPPVELRRLRGSTVYDGWIDGVPVRVASVALAPAGGGGDPTDALEVIDVRVAETLNKRRLLASEVLLSVLLPQGIVVAIAAAVIGLTLRRQLAPIADVAESLQAQTHHSLEPVDDRALPREVRPLTQALNELLLRLRAALLAQRDFVADAAHQLRTPLTALKLHAEEAARETDPVRLRPVIDELQRAADRAVRLSNQLLSLARAEPSARIAEPRRFDLRVTAFDAAAHWVPVALKAGLDLGFEDARTYAGPIEVIGDPDLMTEALNNLIDNAIRHAGGASRITVSVGTGPGHTAHLLVEDDGEGIPEPERDRVFERFWRGAGASADVAATGARSDAGLGLAIVAEIARGHSGGVRIETGAGGWGAAVRIDLPRAPAAEREGAPRPQPPASVQGTRQPANKSRAPR